MLWLLPLLALPLALAWDPNCFISINHRFYDLNNFKR